MTFLLGKTHKPSSTEHHLVAGSTDLCTPTPKPGSGAQRP